MLKVLNYILALMTLSPMVFGYQAAQSNKSPISVSSQLYSEVPKASPDLSYDGFQLLIEDLKSEGISQDCQLKVDDFMEFKRIQNINFEKFSENIRLVQDVFINWSNQLKPFINQRVAFAKETFGPLKTLIDALNETATQMEKNSIVTDDFAYELSEFLTSCESFDPNWIMAFDSYYTNLMTTQSELWRYYIESSQLLAKEYEKLKFFEAEETQLFTEKELDLIQKLGKTVTGSSGFGEMRNLYLLVIDVFYLPELDKLEKQLEESTNVESRSMH
jgi:hypothetical protein